MSAIVFNLRIVNIVFGKAGFIRFNSLINNAILYERKIGIDLLRNL